ncbi:hypothetical protein SKAU_G00142460 [Synaphobranchus kaupii]|uniref:Uncharacterized protein n=1 Tax=Synaphobranchus kaupii TaxID=118154 RepID=A0A9Q1FTF4_SYNKA|nr:hypothetical protein SKAU_G00142460 [Synaphobranchus kaupii]
MLPWVPCYIRCYINQAGSPLEKPQDVANAWRKGLKICTVILSDMAPASGFPPDVATQRCGYRHPLPSLVAYLTPYCSRTSQGPISLPHPPPPTPSGDRLRRSKQLREKNGPRFSRPAQ